MKLVCIDNKHLSGNYPLILVIVLAIIFSYVYNFVREEIKYKKRMNKLKEWSILFTRIKDWSSEISDPHIKQLFLTECYEKFLWHIPGSIGTKEHMERISQLNPEIAKEQIISKWGRYIPSLLCEVRDSRLNQIGL